jgi:hypothetical protein
MLEIIILFPDYIDFIIYYRNEVKHYFSFFKAFPSIISICYIEFLIL